MGVWEGGGGGGEYGGHEFGGLFLRVHRHGLVDHTVRDHIKQCRGEVSEPDFNERRKDVDVGGLRATTEGGRDERGGGRRSGEEGEGGGGAEKERKVKVRIWLTESATRGCVLEYEV